jgi:G3E family GTPase
MSHTQARRPVVLLAGFLGSGKTTLLNSLLRLPGSAGTAVLVNEFGAIGLDQAVFGGCADDVRLLAGGCLCCELRVGLAETLADLQLRRDRGQLPPFRRVVIEASGLADPAPIANTLLGHRLITDWYRFAATVCCVDLEHPPQNGLARKQIALAERLVFTKADRVPAELAAARRKAAQQLNPRAAWFNSIGGDAAGAAFADLDSALATTGWLPLHDLAEHAELSSAAFYLPRTISWAEWASCQRALHDHLGARLLRLKALARIEAEPAPLLLHAVQGVFHPPERLAAWPDTEPRGRLVGIAMADDLPPFRAALAPLGVTVA